ncbi:hypothetical protein ABW20_dc0108407 [Dactylellina cionopaga]|nr:hypothetical protein ABW20_dc0108407 [Dactylellina cionopaga]
MTAARVASSASVHRFLTSPKLPDFARILPPESIFASARKSGFLKCNKAEATTVLSAIWKETHVLHHGDTKARTVAVSEICKFHAFPPSNFTSLALLLQSSPLATGVTTDLLQLAESLNDPPAVLKSARSKVTSSRSITILESTPIWRKLSNLAAEQQVPEAYELMAETYEGVGNRTQALHYWTKAAEVGSGTGCLMIGRRAARGGKTDVAIEWFKKAAELNEAEGYYELGVLQSDINGAEAEHNLLAAAASGVNHAAAKLEQLYKSRNDDVMSEQWRLVAQETENVHNM